MRVERALLVAAGLATGCTPRPALDVWVPKVAAPQMCAPRAEDPRAAAVLAAFPPGLEGDVRLVSLRGDDRLQHAGHGVARWSHDGRALVTATGRALIVWDPVSGAPKHTVSLGQGRAVVVDMAVSRTGAQVALVTSRREGPGNMATSRLLVVRPADGALRVLGHTSTKSLRFSTDESRLIGSRQVWDVASGKPIWGAVTFSGARPATLRDVLSPPAKSSDPTPRAFTHWFDDGRRGVELRREGARLMLERWVPERAERTPIASWTDAAGSPAGLPATGYALSPNGHFFVAAENGEVRRWSLVDGTAKRLPAPADWRGKDLALSNDGASLAVWERRVTLPLGLPPGFSTSTWRDTTVRLWDLATAAQRWSRPHDGTQLLFSADDAFLVQPRHRVVSTKVIEVASGQTFAKHGHLLATHLKSRRALARHGRQAPRVVQLDGSRAWPARAGVSERVVGRSSMGATVTRDRHGRLRLRTSGQCVALAAELSSTRFSDDGRWLFGIGSAPIPHASAHAFAQRAATSVTLWDADSGRVLGAAALDRRAHEIRVLPSTAEIMVHRQRDGVDLVGLLLPPTPRQLSPAPVGGPPNALGSRWQQTTRDGRYLFGVRRAHHLSLWDRSGGPAIDLAHRRVPHLVALSPDDRFVAMVPEKSGQVRWWRLADRKKIDGPDLGTWIEGLHFNADSSVLAVVKRGAVHLVSVTTGAPIAKVDLRQRYDGVERVTWTGPHTLTIDTERGAAIVVEHTTKRHH